MEMGGEQENVGSGTAANREEIVFGTAARANSVDVEAFVRVKSEDDAYASSFARILRNLFVTCHTPAAG